SPFEKVAASLADVHEAVVAGLRATSGDEWLDAACGTGELAFLAAAAGAHVTGMDFAPALVETARRQADERGLHIHFDVGDVEAMGRSIEARVSVRRAASGQADWDYMVDGCGPLRTLTASLAAERNEELRQEWIDFTGTMREGDEIVHRREYLLILGTRR